MDTPAAEGQPSSSSPPPAQPLPQQHSTPDSTMHDVSSPGRAAAVFDADESLTTHGSLGAFGSRGARRAALLARQGSPRTFSRKLASIARRHASTSARQLVAGRALLLHAPDSGSSDRSGWAGSAGGGGSTSGTAGDGRHPFTSFNEGHGASMWLTACVVLKAALGVGVLSIPGAFSRLGWIPAAFVLTALSAIVMYSGSLYTRLMTRPYRSSRHGLRHPPMLHSLARLALGRAGEVAAYLTAYATILLMPAIFHITAVEALGQLMGSTDNSSLLLHGLGVLVVAVALAQLQSLTQLGWTSLLGSAVMTAALIVATAKLLLEPPPDSDSGSASGASNAVFGLFGDPSSGLGPSWPDALWRAGAPVSGADNGAAVFRGVGGDSGVGGLILGGSWRPRTELIAHRGFGTAMVGVMDMVFAFGGQENWMRFITGMRHRSQFTGAVALSTAVLAPLLVVLGAAGYVARGTDMDPSRPITSELRSDGWSLAINGCVLVSVLISYQINLNVWTRLVLGLCGPRSMRIDSGGGDGEVESESDIEEDAACKETHHGSGGTTAADGSGNTMIGQEVPRQGGGGGTFTGAAILAGTAVDVTEGMVVVQLPPVEPEAAVGANVGVRLLSPASADIEAPAGGGVVTATTVVLPRGDRSDEEKGPGDSGVGGGDSLTQPLLLGTHGTAAYRHYLEERRRRRQAHRTRHGEPLDPGSQRLLWLLLTCCAGCFGYVAGFLLPYFSEVVAVIASVGDMALMLGLPCLCALQLLRLSVAETALCWALTVAAVLMSIVGAVLSIERLVDRAHGGGGGEQGH